MEEYKVLITTSGIGSRLGELTDYTNKCLVRIGKKPAISYIVESYDKDIEIVVTLGYYGNQVQDFLELAYPDRKFTFVQVDKYQGEGSSLGYTTIPEPYYNWLGICNKENISQYRSIWPYGDGVKKIRDKGDDLQGRHAYIGLAGINNYDGFWNMLEHIYQENPNMSSLCDCDAINGIINKTWTVQTFPDWLDIGNITELNKAREEIYDKFEILDKVDESIYIFDDFVIKFFYDTNICKNRVKRGNLLGELTPNILDSKDNFYKYEFVNGELLSSVVNENIFEDLLNWSSKNLWIPVKESEDFRKKCYSFYHDKTTDRINKFLEIHNMEDIWTEINGYKIPPIYDLLDDIEWDELSKSHPYQFHGDFILDNIIYQGKDQFKLIDWRQDFGGDIIEGDFYYDLAKLNHNLLFNHDIVNKGHFYVKEDGNGLKIDILRSDILTNCREILKNNIKFSNFDLNKINLLTALIWLNMAPLHEEEMGRFLKQYIIND
jgi:hypothetical protein